jgi:ABC-type glucose/galactose transport system permease subunit
MLVLSGITFCCCGGLDQEGRGAIEESKCGSIVSGVVDGRGGVCVVSGVVCGVVCGVVFIYCAARTFLFITPRTLMLIGGHAIFKNNTVVEAIPRAQVARRDDSIMSSARGSLVWRCTYIV